jgi:hypothetical protein
MLVQTCPARRENTLDKIVAVIRLRKLQPQHGQRGIIALRRVAATRSAVKTTLRFGADKIRHDTSGADACGSGAIGPASAQSPA